MQGLFDQIATVIRNFGHRYVTESVFVVLFVLFVHLVVYPLTITRANQAVPSGVPSSSATVSPATQPIAPASDPEPRSAQGALSLGRAKADTRVPQSSGPAVPRAPVLPAPSGTTISGNNSGNSTVQPAVPSYPRYRTMEEW